MWRKCCCPLPRSTLTWAFRQVHAILRLCFLVWKRQPSSCPWGRRVSGGTQASHGRARAQSQATSRSCGASGPERAVLGHAGPRDAPSPSEQLADSRGEGAVLLRRRQEQQNGRSSHTNSQRGHPHGSRCLSVLSREALEAKSLPAAFPLSLLGPQSGPACSSGLVPKTGCWRGARTGDSFSSLCLHY